MTVLTDKIAVVTGAGSGIGEAIATLLHEEGVKVILAGRNKDKLQNVANQLAQDSVKVVPTDVTKKEEVDELIKIAQQTFGGSVVWILLSIVRDKCYRLRLLIIK